MEKMSMYLVHVLAVFLSSIYDASSPVDGTGSKFYKCPPNTGYLTKLILLTGTLVGLLGRSPFGISIHFNFPLRGDGRYSSQTGADKVSPYQESMTAGEM